MSNIFRNLGAVYFQVPEEFVFDENHTLAQMSGNALKLYMLVLATAQRRSKPAVELTSTAIKEATGIGVNGITPAAKELAISGLVHLTQHKGTKWGYTFELLDPGTALPVPTLHKRKLDASRLTRTQVYDYFNHHLGAGIQIIHDDGSMMALCPFHDSEGRKGTLSLKTSVGGAFKCHHAGCEHGAGGSLIDFQVSIDKKQGRYTNQRTAWERVVAIIKSIERKEAQEKRSVELAQVDLQACDCFEEDELHQEWGTVETISR